MVYELTKDYLYENFTGDSSDIDFSEQHAQSLAQQIAMVGECGSVSDNKDDIRKALKDFWGSIGNVSVFFKGQDKLAVKVIPKAQDEISTYTLREEVTKGKELAFVKEIIHQLCNESLDFSLISNRIWESSYLAYVKSEFFKAVYKESKGNRELATEISLDIIRDNFAYLNDCLAEELLAKMLTSRKAATFIEYYGKVVLGEGGIRFKAPDIIDRKKRQWHVSTMRPVISKYLKEEAISKKNKDLIDSISEKLENLNSELMEIMESRDRIENDKVEAVISYSESGEELQELRMFLQELGIKLNTASADQKEEIEKKIRAQKNLIEEAKKNDIIKRIDKGKFEKLSKDRDEKEFRLKKKIEGTKIQLQAEEGTISKQNSHFGGTKEAYDYIVDAVANALMRKKMVVD